MSHARVDGRGRPVRFTFADTPFRVAKQQLHHLGRALFKAGEAPPRCEWTFRGWEDQLREQTTRIYNNE